MDIEGQRRIFKKVLEPKAMKMKGLAWQICRLKLKKFKIPGPWGARKPGQSSAGWPCSLFERGLCWEWALVLMGGRAVLVPILELTRSVRRNREG